MWSRHYYQIAIEKSPATFEENRRKMKEESFREFTSRNFTEFAAEKYSENENTINLTVDNDEMNICFIGTNNKHGCGSFPDNIDTPILDNKASGTANVCEIEGFMNMELGDPGLKKNFQGMTDYVNEFPSHLLEVIKYLWVELKTKLFHQNIVILKISEPRRLKIPLQC